MKKRYDFIPQQLGLPIWKPKDATPQEFEDWYENELKPQGDNAFKMVIVATITQILSLAFMASAMLIIHWMVYG